MKLTKVLLGYLLLLLVGCGDSPSKAQETPETTQSSQVETDLFNWFMKTVRDSIKIDFSKTPALDLAQFQAQVLLYTSVLQKINADPTTTELIIRIKNEFYEKDGEYFHGMLLAAARDKEGRDAFIRGLRYEKDVDLFPGWDLVWEKIWSGSDKVSFGKTQLKANIDELELRLEKFGLPKKDFSKLTTDSLDVYEPYFKLFVQLDPKLPQLISTLFGYYTEKSLKNLTQTDLILILEKLISFLSDTDHGALWFIQEAKPRS